MITTSDSFSTIDIGKYFAILPSSEVNSPIYNEFREKFSPVPEGFTYNSGTNPDFLGVEELRELIKRHVCANFEPV